MEKVKGQNIKWYHCGMKRMLMAVEWVGNGKGINSQEPSNFLYYSKEKKKKNA